MVSVDPTVAVDAIRLVDEDRQDQYGDYDENLSRIAGLWSSFLGADISAMDVSLMMVLVKISRCRAGYARDNAVDGVAYFLMHDSLARYDNGDE
jgi:muramidase (phage lysozyme)